MQPNETTRTGRATNSAVMAQRAAERAEDLAWMARTGETTEGAATRIGLSVESLERWCDKNARETWHQLRTNDRTQGHVRAGKLRVA